MFLEIWKFLCYKAFIVHTMYYICPHILQCLGQLPVIKHSISPVKHKNTYIKWEE